MNGALPVCPTIIYIPHKSDAYYAVVIAIIIVPCWHNVTLVSDKYHHYYANDNNNEYFVDLFLCVIFYLLCELLSS